MSRRGPGSPSPPCQIETADQPLVLVDGDSANFLFLPCVRMEVLTSSAMGGRGEGEARSPNKPLLE